MDGLLRQGIWSSEDIEVETGPLSVEIESMLRAADIRRDVRDARTFIGTIPWFSSRLFSDNGSLLIYVVAQMTVVHVVAWDVATRSERFWMELSDSVAWAGQSPDGKYVGSSSWNRSVKIWNAHSGKLVHTLEVPQSQNWAAAFSPDSKLITVGSGDKIVYVWNVETGDLVNKLTGLLGYIRTLVFSKDGAYLAVGGLRGTVRVFDMHTGQSVQHWQEDNGKYPPWETSKLQYTPDWTKIAFKNSDRRIIIYDFEENRKWEYQQSADASINREFLCPGDLLFTPDGRTVILADPDNSVRFRKL